MFEMIMIMLFGGHTLVSSEIELVNREPREVKFAKPIQALNCSASFNVDVSKHVTSNNYQEAEKEVKSKFPESCINIRLKSESGQVAHFSKSSVRWGGPGKVSVNLRADSGLQEGTEYSSLVVDSCREITSSSITFYNYGKSTCRANHAALGESGTSSPTPNPSIEGDVQGLSPSAAPHVKR